MVGILPASIKRPLSSTPVIRTASAPAVEPRFGAHTGQDIAAIRALNGTSRARARRFALSDDGAGSLIVSADREEEERMSEHGRNPSGPGDKGAASRVGAPSLGAPVLIALVIGGLALAFAYTGGWLSPGRLTPGRMVAALSDRGGNPLGHRRNHSKGICFTGTVEANGAGVRLSTAPMFASGSYPVIGRFPIATGNPEASDASTPVRSMAIRVVAPDGEEWRSGMNDSPMFVVATPQAFYEMTLAQDVDPATGKPNPAAIERFFATHPESTL